MKIAYQHLGSAPLVMPLQKAPWEQQVISFDLETLLPGGDPMLHPPKPAPWTA